MPLAPLRIPNNLRKSLEKKDHKLQAAIAECILQLRKDWRHPGLRCSKLSGTNIYHARVDGGNRVTFFWEGDRIVIQNHCNHGILKERR